MKQIILLLTLLFTFNASAQYTILSAVQLNEGAEDQYLALEAFMGPVHDLAIEKGIQNSQAVWKITSESEAENAPHYIIFTSSMLSTRMPNFLPSGFSYFSIGDTGLLI